MTTVPTSSRYQILRQIGAGDFAAVFAARDLKLGRDVAIKQIHQQFLANPDKLARYWQEAQLLASFEHPNIMTIYDIVEARGCLVLELMQGSLKDIYQGRAMPLADVRQTLLQAANGLAFLHDNGIVHGDIKPGNLLLSRQSLVKLGDFGLARRVSDPDGSLLKGTTKYMAPELVSEQFGPVGPASDLYSLGFAAFEMMCGPEFDSLFPEITTFGRDQQMAWMLWHSAADRKLPDIQSVLEGVPADLAYVLQRLTAKNQAQRYKSAKEVIADLSAAGGAAPVGAALKEEAAAAEAAAKAKKKKRLIAIGAFAASVILSIAALFIPTESKPPPAPPPIPGPVEGVVQNILLNDQKFVLAVGDNWNEITLFDQDRILLNQRERQLRDLKVGDKVVVRTLLDEAQNQFREIRASRPESHRGSVKSIQADEGHFVLHVEEGEEEGSDIVLKVPSGTPLKLNGLSKQGDQPLTLADLKPGDRVSVEHNEIEGEPSATSIAAQRVIPLDGFVRFVNLKRRELTVSLSQDPAAPLVTLPLGDPCEITLNGLRFVDNKVLTLADILPGDKVSLRHDLRIVGLDAYRVFARQGSVRQIAFEARTITVKNQGESEPTVYVLAPECKITLSGEAAQLTDLRIGDNVALTSDTPGSKSPPLLTIDASRPSDHRKWAILVSNQNFDDGTLTKLSYPLATSRKLRDRLMKRYAVPPEQVIHFEDESRVRLEQGIADAIARVPVESELYIYVSTHAYAVAQANVYLASKDFALARTVETGIKLDWLLEQLDGCKSKQKLLLLDCSHAGTGADLAQQPSTSEMVDLMIRTHRKPYMKSLHILASCEVGQRGLANWDDPSFSLFGATLVEAFSGAADKARDNQLEITELSQFLEGRMQTLASAHAAAQKPRLFLPNDAPPRLGEEARQAILGLLTKLSQTRIDSAAVRFEADQAQTLAKGQPEPMLVCGLLMIKAREWDKALEVLEPVRLAHKQNLAAQQAVTWIHFFKRDYDTGLGTLKTLVQQIPRPSMTGKEYDKQALALCEWSGSLRELAVKAPWNMKTPSPALVDAIDKAIAEHGKEAGELYEQGRANTRKVLEAFEKQMEEDPANASKINLSRRTLSNYVTFDLQLIAATITEGLDR